LGTPKSISSCAPMIERVRPAQLTTNRGRRIRHDVPDAQRQLAVRTADAARDVHLVEFGECAAIDDHDIFPASRMAWSACAVTRGV